MRDFILTYPHQLEEALTLARGKAVRGDFRAVVVAGMGGSAWPAEIVTSALEPPTPVLVVRTYTLPPFVTHDMLFLASSYSGNTEETLACYEEARARRLTRAAVTSGGLLAEACRLDDVPCVMVPAGFVPRMATGYLFASLALLMAQAKCMPDPTDAIRTLAHTLKPELLEGEGEHLAAQLTESVLPVVYASDTHKGLAYAWKIKLNEGMKMHAFAHSFPELNHTEMSAFALASASARILPIFLRDDDDHPRILKRMEATREIMEQHGYQVLTVPLRGASRLEKIFSSLILADWMVYYGAHSRGVDPLETTLQEVFKKNIAE